VQDYIDKLCELVDQLQAYSHNVDPLYYTTRFIDGLNDDIKHLIIVHRPKDLDTACCLALLHEETNPPHSKEIKKVEGGYHNKYPFKGAFPLPRPSLQLKQDNIPEDKNRVAGPKSQYGEEKLAALSAYRMARGLCRKCGEKWGKGHKCAESVHLNMLQAVWELFESDSPTSQSMEPKAEHSKQLFMAISDSAMSGTKDLAH
jgi:hypothetical protein